MVVMALDHTRDFLSHDALLFPPLDLSQTYAALFSTRWITHFCAPVFCFLAGTAAFLSLTRGKTKTDLARFLITRGLWLVLLELTVMQFAWTFNFDIHSPGGGVIWALGWSMVALAALIYLPVWGIAAFGIVMIGTHNLFDSVPPEAFGSLGWLWNVLHAGNPIHLSPTYTFYILYPLVPGSASWPPDTPTGVVKLDRARRRRRTLWLGIGLCAACCDPCDEHLWRSFPVVAAAEPALYRVLVHQMREIPSLFALSADDTWPFLHRTRPA